MVVSFYCDYRANETRPYSDETRRDNFCDEILCLTLFCVNRVMVIIVIYRFGQLFGVYHTYNTTYTINVVHLSNLQLSHNLYRNLLPVFHRHIKIALEMTEIFLFFEQSMVQFFGLIIVGHSFSGTVIPDLLGIGQVMVSDQPKRIHDGARL